MYYATRTERREQEGEEEERVKEESKRLGYTYPRPS
jgi:hypothetical protein